MSESGRPIVPLLGALLVAEGLITQEQVNAALLLQQEDYPNERLGEILVRCGYISAENLSRVLLQQHNLREALLAVMEPYTPESTDLRALVISRQPEHSLCAFMRACGVVVIVSPALPAPEQQPAYDLMLVAADCAGMLGVGVSLAATIGLLPPGESNEMLAPATAALVAHYIDQARAHIRLRRSMDLRRHSDFEMRTIITLIRGVTMAQTPQNALLKLMMIIRDLVAVEAGTLFRLDPNDKRLVFEVVLGPFQNELSQRRLSIDKGIAGWVARNGEPLLIPDVSQDPRFESSFDRQTGFQTRSMVCVPLVALGEVRGVLQLINKIDGAFTENDLALIRITAAVGGMLLLFEALASVSAPSWLGDLF